MSRLTRVFLGLNIAIAGMTLGAPRAFADELPWWTDCCKPNTEGQKFCCDECCFMDSLRCSTSAGCNTTPT